MARSLGLVGDAEAADEEHLRGITDATEAIEFIQERWSDAELLIGDAVHDAKGEEAADINNAGIYSQLEYLTGERPEWFGKAAADILYG